MSVVSVKARSFILALFIRDDGERFLLGDNGYDFKDSQLHFAANTIENDEVMKQGADGVIVAGQVRRASVQSFDGYVGDATMAKETIEQMRRDFFAFFVKGHHFRVVYIDCNRNAWQRKGGYLVDAPEVKELWQIHPEYHVGLNFEDVNYYSYNEDADGEEILSNLVDVPVSTAASGGLVWDEDGAVSEDAVVDHDAESAGAQGKSVYINDAAEAPLSAFKLDGETSQTTYTGKNLLKYPYRDTTVTRNDVKFTDNGDGTITANGTATADTLFWLTKESWAYTTDNIVIPAGTYTVSKTGKSYATIFVSVYGKTQGQIGSVNVSTSDATFTTTEEASLTVRLKINSGATGNGLVIRPQIEAGSTATDFEPYVGGVASPNPDYPQAVNTTTGENVVKIIGENPLQLAQDTSGGGSYDAATNTYTSTTRTGANAWCQKIKVDGSNCTVITKSVSSAEYRCVFSNTNVSTGAEMVSLTNGTGSGAISAGVREVINSGNATYFYISFRTATSGQTATIENPILSLPYQGQSYEVNLDIPTGKNLLNPNWSFSRQYYGIDGTLSDFYFFALFDKYFDIEPNTAYSFSSSHSNQNMAIAWFDDSKTFISRSASGTTSVSETSPANARYARLQIRYDADTAITTALLNTINLQFEKGAVSSYEPYRPIELCKIGDYQDYIYRSGDKWYKHKAVEKIALSSLTGWGRSENGKFFFSGFASTYGVVAGDGYSDQFDYSGTAWSADYRFGITGSGNLWVATGDSTLTSADLFNTWLQNHNPVAYFQLATPTDTEITNEALIAQLEAVLGGHTYAGTNNIFTVTPNEQGTLEIGYYTKYQLMVVGGGYVWEAGGAGGATIVVNNSIDNVNPIWKIYGPTMNPQLENSTTGEVIEYVGLIAEGQTLTIDMGEQTASLDGLNVISNLVGDFVSLAPGANRLIYSVSGDAGASEIGWSEIVG